MDAAGGGGAVSMPAGARGEVRARRLGANETNNNAQIVCSQIYNLHKSVEV